MAYGQKGDLAQADLASAQAAFMRGDIKTARELAARAKTRFPVGSPGWVKADDIASYKPPQSAWRDVITEKDQRPCDFASRPFAAALIAGRCWPCRPRSLPRAQSFTRRAARRDRDASSRTIC